MLTKFHMDVVTL